MAATKRRSDGATKGYATHDGRVVFVTSGISDGRGWFTGHRTHTGSIKRVVSPRLPIRCTFALAQADLDAMALLRGWQSVEVTSNQQPATGN